MNLPRWIVLFLSEFFSGTQVDIINKNWYNFSQLSLSNSSREELLLQAKIILSLSKT
jgi:hypothetical protein